MPRSPAYPAETLRLSRAEPLTAAIAVSITGLIPRLRPHRTVEETPTPDTLLLAAERVDGVNDGRAQDGDRQLHGLFLGPLPPFDAHHLGLYPEHPADGNAVGVGLDHGLDEAA